jgi:hypothetical protein
MLFMTSGEPESGHDPQRDILESGEGDFGAQDQERFRPIQHYELR